MEPQIEVFIFGDQTNASDADLRQLLHVNDNSVLRSFFERVTYALRVEIARLTRVEQEAFPRYNTLLELLSARRREYAGNPALGLALLCTNQLGRFIKYYSEGSRRYPHSSTTYAMGQCTGSFAAAAISSSQTVAELVPAGIEAILVAFRTGLRSSEARSDIEPRCVASAVWSVVVGMQEEHAASILNMFAEAKGLSNSSRPYISAVTSMNVTISGPSMVLQQVLQSEAFAAFEPKNLPINAPYHAAHIYGPPDIEAILAPCDQAILDSYASKFPLISSATGKRVLASTYRSLLRDVLKDVLVEQLRWDKVLKEGATEFTQASPSSRIVIYPILTSTAQGLASRLSQVFSTAPTIDSSCTARLREEPSTIPSGNPEQSKIAIVGCGGRFPDAESIEKFWEILHKGLDVHRKIPEDRFDVTAHYDSTGRRKNTSKVQHGCFIEKPGLFDARFFNMSPRESSNADPGQRLAITTAYEALEMAGFVADTTPSTQRNRVGIFYGMTSDDWREVNSGQNIDTYFIPGGNRAFTPGRINYHFNFSGPSFSIDTACSSSFAAIHIACNSLWRGDCDTAIAGGTNIMTNPDNFAGLDRGHFLSPTGNCNTFDDGANGYCRADAVGTVVLKRLEDAEADNDPIRGVILGAYTNHSAEADSMTRPHVGAQASVFNNILDVANVDPLDVSYIEMHGTGTQAGDAVEMSSVLDVFAPGKRGPEHPLHLGSVKANVGHAESASGVTSLIKVLKMMEENEIPPHCGIKTKINHNFPSDLEARNVNIALKPTDWRRPEQGERKRTVFLNNFSAAGGNTALLLEDAPTKTSMDHLDPRSAHLVAVSGKSKFSVQKNVDALIAFINDNPEVSLPSLAYTSTARRMHHNHRVIVSGHGLASIKDALQCLGPSMDTKPIPVLTKVPSVNFVFTGQGSLYASVGRQLFDHISSYRASIKRFDGIAQCQGFPSFLPLIDGLVSDLQEVRPLITQVGIVCVQMALAQLWISWGVYPSTVIGHSLGEYAALYTAGVISASDAIFLAGTKARLLEERCTVGTHAMLAVKSSLSPLSQLISRENCEVACINGPNQIVLSGLNTDIDTLSKVLTAQNIKCTKLDVAFAFHSAQVECILPEFESAAKAVVFDKPSIPYMSPLLGEVIKDKDILGPSYLGRACRVTVNFQAALVAGRNAGSVNDGSIWVEIGAHPVCSNMIKATLGSHTSVLSSLRRHGDIWKVLAQSLSSLHLAGIDLKWKEYHRDFEKALRVIQLPSYQWDSKNYWIQYSNDFCLTKGDERSAITSVSPLSTISALSTSSVQKVVEQQLGAEKSSLIMESDLHHPSLSGVIQGHAVNGAALCPSSLYADIALSVADYLLQATKTDTEGVGMNVSEMTVNKPLIASGSGPQLFRASASADWNARRLYMNFYSVAAGGEKIADHASCTVIFEDTETWLKEWRRNSYLIKTRIDSLEQGVDQGQSHKVKRGLAYKLFGALVDYSQCYQGMQEVILDSAQLEATARIKFQTTEKEENHYFSPYWVDSLGHLAGFVMNANDGIDSKRQVFVNHGWDSMRCATRFSREKVYRNYVRMQNIGGTMYAGDTYIFDGDDVVAIYQGVKFQGIPRQALDNLLPGANAPKAVSKSSVPSRGQSKSTPKSKADASANMRAASSASLPSESIKGDVVTRILEIIGEEAGLEKSELAPSDNFTDIGIDSLLLLNIASRLREDLGLDVDGSLFADCPTVVDLVRALNVEETPPSSRESLASSTPELDSDSTASDEDSADETSLGDDETQTMSIIRRTVAEEVGVIEQELTDLLDLNELGMDSLLSLTILGKLRDELEIELPADLFASNNSLIEIEAALGLKRKAVAPPPEKARVSSTKKVDPVNDAIPMASSVLLQGSPKSATKTLFLFPDGSGSATSYSPLARISPNIAVYGLNCPYMKTPQEMKCSIEAVTPRYLQEIRRRQPSGPYYLGGWSAGGICAFDAAQELDRVGEKVERLILIDSPFPIGLEKLPPRLYDFFKTVGLFGEGDKPPPTWLLPHFLAFVDSLDLYKAKSFGLGRSPPSRLIWARDGVCKFPDSPRPDMNGAPKEMKWLLNNRTEFGSNGWDRLLSGDDMVIETLDDANHFTMMAGGKAKELAIFIRRAMD